MDTLRHLTIYSTEGCHLCEEAEVLLKQVLLMGVDKIEWKSVDIINDPALYERYSLIIPVVRHALSGREIGWPFSVDELYEFVSSLSDRSSD